ncbi:hypothetical protein JCM8547_000302 [Rhodosporidiobolus lusitaniae]
MHPTLKRVDEFLRVKEDKNDESGGTKSRWSNPDLDPVPDYKRKWNMVDLSMFWSSDNFGPGTWSAGSSLVALGWTAREIIPFAFVGGLFCGVVAYFNARAGARTGLCFPVLIRTSFGPWAALVPVFVRALIGLIWLVVLTFQAADVVTICIAAAVPSYNTAIKNIFPESSNVTSTQLLSMFIYWIFQSALLIMPMEKTKHLYNVKGIICPITFIALLIWGVVVTRGGDSPYISGPSTMAGSRVMNALTGINAMASVASTISTNIPDFSRFQRPTRYAWTQIIIMPITACVPVACGVITTSAVYTYYNIEGAWEPAALITNFGDRAIRFFVGAAFLLSYVGVNSSANGCAFANDFSSILPRYFNFRRSAIFACLLCFILQPWFLLRDAGAFLAFLGAYGSFLSGISAIMLVDFWIVRGNGKVDIRDLYLGEKGRYWYWHGINWRAVSAWVISFVPNLPGLAHAINADIPSVNPYTYCVSWFWGTIFAGGLYWAFSVFFPPHKTFVEEAVYRLDGTPAGIEFSESLSEAKLDEEAAYVVPASESK